MAKISTDRTTPTTATISARESTAFLRAETAFAVSSYLSEKSSMGFTFRKSMGRKKLPIV